MTVIATRTERCPGCGNKVEMPCRICRTREQTDRGAALNDGAVAIAEEEPKLAGDTDQLTFAERAQLRRRLDDLRAKLPRDSAPVARERYQRSPEADRGTGELVDRLLKLFYLADRWDVSLHDAFDLAEQKFVVTVDQRHTTRPPADGEPPRATYEKSGAPCLLAPATRPARRGSRPAGGSL